MDTPGSHNPNANNVNDDDDEDNNNNNLYERRNIVNIFCYQLQNVLCTFNIRSTIFYDHYNQRGIIQLRRINDRRRRPAHSATNVAVLALPPVMSCSTRQQDILLLIIRGRPRKRRAEVRHLHSCRDHKCILYTG
ncbi:hypothetical protein ANTQUA_LOCUS610 [Anthophora quadrimaculata]